MSTTQTPNTTRAATRTPTTTTSSTTEPHQPNFTSPTFDAADYLNEILPALSLPSQSQPRSTGSSLSDLSTRTQSLLSAITAQNVRLSTTLSQLSDEILRSGGRLAYEVEVLRGEAIALGEGLKGEKTAGDIGVFVPGGVPDPVPSSSLSATTEAGRDATENDAAQTLPEESDSTVADPSYITNLRTLTAVRARLEEVVHTFGEAMEWTLPPSETSLTSSFISVSAPEPGDGESSSREERGQEVAKSLRREVSALLDGEGGVEGARERVEALRTLAVVWKGSAEEKARLRFVEGLEKMVEDRRRVLDQAEEAQRGYGQSQARRSSVDRRRDSDSGGPGGGIFRNLHRLREEIYLE